MAALALGTYGAHVFRPKNPAYKEVWHTASTCYAVAYLEDRKFSSLAPFGGFAFIGAWANLLF